jgi:hypothetical protein
VCGVWCVVCGVWCVVWCALCGMRSVCGIWYLFGVCVRARDQRRFVQWLNLQESCGSTSQPGLSGLKDTLCPFSRARTKCLGERVNVANILTIGHASRSPNALRVLDRICHVH